MSVDPRRTQPFCDARCYRECRCSRWPHYVNRFGFSVAGSYASKVLGYGPIAYWPLWETAGAIAHDLVDSPAQDGAAVGVTWADDTTGLFGTPAPFFDGANDFVNIYSATFAAAFNGAEGSFLSWQRVANAGAWTDGLNRYVWNLRSGAANQIYHYKLAANNRADEYYTAGGVTEQHIDIPFTETDWWMRVVTWSKSTDEVRYYLDGEWQETDTVLGVWVGGLGATSSVIGAQYTTPSNMWHGWLAHCAIWDRALTATEIAELAEP